MSLKMRKPDWTEIYEREYDYQSAQHPKYDAHELDRLACEEANHCIAYWADMMIDRAKDEQKMDEGGGSQAKKPKDEQ